MHIGYNTNGFAHHRLDDAIAILAEIGYRGVAITLDHHALNPFGPHLESQTRRVADLLDRHGLRCVIETGSRFLLDPWCKHQPTLLDPDQARRQQRLDFLMRAIDLAGVLGADAVSFWSGALPTGVEREAAMTRLVDECLRLAEHAEQLSIRLAFEPEPGMFIDRMSGFAELHERVGHPLFGLTLDVGHVHCLDDGSIGEHLRAWRDRLFNVHLEDMKRGRHEHLMFGEGEMDMPAVLAELSRIDYSLGVYVELPGHAHNAVVVARQAYALVGHALPNS